MLELTICKTCHIYSRQLLLIKTSEIHPTENWMMLPLLNPHRCTLRTASDVAQSKPNYVRGKYMRTSAGWKT